MDLGYDIHFLLDLDVLSLTDLAMIAGKIRDSRIMEQAHVMSLAMNGDKEAWKKFNEAYSDKTKVAESHQNDADALKRLVESGGLK